MLRQSICPAIPLWLILGAGIAAADAAPPCVPMDIPVARVEASPTQYSDFCKRHPASCVLDGAPVTEWSAARHDELRTVNREVNAEIEFVSDMDNLGLEERWSFPQDCRGDCEDFALEKRRRLVALGWPRASLRIGIAFHETEFFPHALLLAETSRGTWVLDNLANDLLCWNSVPYRFTRRERPDGQWDRFER